MQINRFGAEPDYPATREAIRFEIKGFVGRMLSPSQRRPAFPLLHLGCGPNLIPGFENVDFYAMKFWKARHVGHDLRVRLPYADASFDGAFSEHTLEHLRAADAVAMLREVRRVLKPGAVFRVVVPDLGQYIAFYNGAASDPGFQQFEGGCEAIWSLTQNFGHLSCWDGAMLSRQLVAAGFATADRVAFGEGREPRLLRDTEARRWESLYVEAVA